LEGTICSEVKRPVWGWRRIRADTFKPYTPHLNPLRHALQLSLASLIERDPSRRPREITHGLRHQHLTGSGLGCDPGSDIHRAAETALFLSDHVAGVYPEVEGQAHAIACPKTSGKAA